MNERFRRESTHGRPDDRWARWFVWGVWGAMILIVLVSFARNARDIPLAEDWLLVPALTGHEPDLWRSLWEQNNEHRIPLPKAILLALLRLTGGDFRAGMLFNIALIGAAAAALILVARGARGGRTRFADAFFPVLLLHLGNWENLFWGWQLTQILPTLLALAILMAFVRHRDLSHPAAVWTVAIALLALPLCGANGLLFVPLPALWMAYRGVETLRGSPGRRGAGFAMLAVPALALLLSALYFVDYRRPEWILPNPGIVPSMAVALQFLAFGLGPAVQRAWGPATALSLGTMLIAAAVLIAAVVVRRGEERRRAIGLTIFAANVAAFVFAIGWGRAGALDVFGYWPLRYVLMATPAFCTAYLAFDLYGTARLRQAMQLGLLALVVLLVPLNTLGGWVWRDWYGGEAAALHRELSAGRSATDIATRRGEFLIHWWEPQRLVAAMRMLHDARMGPFARLDLDAADVPDDTTAVERQAVGAGGRPLVAHTFVYRLPSAGEVWLVWGVDGWLPLVDTLRPPGTELHRRVMRTPMRRESGEFRAVVRIPARATVEYGFLTLRRLDGVDVRQLWDARPDFTSAGSDTTLVARAAVELESVKSRGIWPWIVSVLAVLIPAGLWWLRAGSLVRTDEVEVAEVPA